MAATPEPWPVWVDELGPFAAAVPGGRVTPADLPSGRVYSVGQPTWIYPEPRVSEAKLGYVRFGQSVPVLDARPVPGAGCHSGFVSVEPLGWVCLGSTASLEVDSRWLRAMHGLEPLDGPWPFRFALSNGAPMYRRLPTPPESERAERFFGVPGTFESLSWGNRGHEHLAEVWPIPAVDGVPWFLSDGGSARRAVERELVRKPIPLGSMLSYTHAFSHGGRTYLLSADGTAVPADRVRPFRPSRFHGVRLGAGVELPVAFIRGQAQRKYDLADDGVRPTDTAWPARSWVALASEAEPSMAASAAFLPTRDSGKWVRADGVTVVQPETELPWSITERDRWILVRITAGTLVAYEGRTPVYATLISPGAGGVPLPGTDPVERSTTPMGIFRVRFKHHASTMAPGDGEPDSFWIADVPYTQYFAAPFALHTAYWHDRFGEPMSAGCVNLSPIDAHWLFDWTSPALPPGWGGVAPGPQMGEGTFVVVRR